MILPLYLCIFLLIYLPPAAKSLSPSPPPQSCLNFLGQTITLHPSMMGDDYCDCYSSGLDELGLTSACSHIPYRVMALQLASSSASSSPSALTQETPPQILFSCSESTVQILHSRVNDGICDCCSGNDESPFINCPNTCSSENKMTMQLRTLQLNRAVNGYTKLLEKEKEAKGIMEGMEVKLKGMEDELNKVDELSYVVALYIKKEKGSKPDLHPRQDYSLQAKRILAKDQEKTTLKQTTKTAAQTASATSTLDTVLNTKCPTSEFTLQDYITVSTLPLAHPFRQKIRALKAEDTLIAPFIETPGLAILRVVGFVVFSPVYVVTKGANLVLEGLLIAARKFGLDVAVESAIGSVEIAAATSDPSAIGSVEITAAISDPIASIPKNKIPFTPMGFLQLLSTIDPKLDFRRYAIARAIVFNMRKVYFWLSEPLGIMWDAPELFFNTTKTRKENYFKETDTHEYRLFLASETNLKEHHKQLSAKITKQEGELEFDYGGNNVWVTSGRGATCFFEPVEKYNYKFCSLGDVFQDNTKLGTFTSWNPNYTSYVITHGTRCHGQQTIDKTGRRIALHRSGTVHLVCGELNSIVSVKEDSICVYEIYVSTPLACNVEGVLGGIDGVKGLVNVGEEGDELRRLIEKAEELVR